MNHLQNESSPYLRQHADNPVNWYPWGEAALRLAETQQRPILLSIGYSACHWCHVMAHESFEDAATAAIMNRHFVNIKVDREERPDLDRIYQTAHQLLTRRGGGWPLTLLLTPEDRIPFFAGTYFPREPRYGLPAFAELLTRIATYYNEHQDEIRKQNHHVMATLQTVNRPAEASCETLSATPLDMARQQLAHEYDESHGGFGGAPKFPHPMNLERLLHHWYAGKMRGQADERALIMVRRSLEKMAAGGLFDQLGGGFFRYSVDQRWMIPHFEKMLYDNAQLLPLYAQLWAVTGEARYEQIVNATIGWLKREMAAPQGGYFATLDADSEGGEGRFYTWTQAEIHTILTKDEYAVFSHRFGLDQPANFESRWHLHEAMTITGIADQAGLTLTAVETLLTAACSKLATHRDQRPRPARDEKILTAWNALNIRALAITSRHTGRQDCLSDALRTLDFIRQNLWREGRLLASCKDGKAQQSAYLDDYAFLLDAILETLQLQWRTEDLHFAIALAEDLLTHFYDRENGGFYFTANDQESLFYRPRPFGDEALPAGNGVAARALGRLGHLLGESRYLEAAAHTLSSAWKEITALPHGHNTLLSALEESLQAPRIIILRGNGAQRLRWQTRCLRPFAPHRLCFTIPAAAQNLPGALAHYPPAESEMLAYLCSGSQCGPPLSAFADLDRLLKEEEID